MVAHVPAVPAESRARVRRAHLLKLARAEAQIESGLFGIKEGAALLRSRRARNLVFCKHPAPHLAAVLGDHWQERATAQRLEGVCTGKRAAPAGRRSEFVRPRALLAPAGALASACIGPEAHADEPYAHLAAQLATHTLATKRSNLRVLAPIFAALCCLGSLALAHAPKARIVDIRSAKSSAEIGTIVIPAQSTLRLVSPLSPNDDSQAAFCGRSKPEPLMPLWAESRPKPLMSRMGGKRTLSNLLLEPFGFATDYASEAGVQSLGDAYAKDHSVWRLRLLDGQEGMQGILGSWWRLGIGSGRVYHLAVM